MLEPGPETLIMCDVTASGEKILRKKRLCTFSVSAFALFCILSAALGSAGSTSMVAAIPTSWSLLFAKSTFIVCRRF